MVRHYRDSNGKARITGGADLKKSQSYPKLFFVPEMKSHWSIFEVLLFQNYKSPHNLSDIYTNTNTYIYIYMYI